MPSPQDLCRCGHPRKDHCKGKVFHSNYKDAMRQVPHPRGSVCLSTHCEAPICCCTNFREAPPK